MASSSSAAGSEISSAGGGSFWSVTQGDYGSIAASILAIGLGNGGTSFAATVAGSTGVGDAEQGFVGGLLNSTRQLGSGLGVAIMTAVATGVAARYAGAEGASLTAGYQDALFVAASFAAAALVVTALFVPGGPVGRVRPEAYIRRA